MSNPVATKAFEQIKAIVIDKLGVEESKVALDTAFEELGADSLDLVELVMALEETFNIEISDEDAEKIKTLSDAVSYVERVTGR